MLSKATQFSPLKTVAETRDDSLFKNTQIIVRRFESDSERDFELGKLKLRMKIQSDYLLRIYEISAKTAEKCFEICVESLPKGDFESRLSAAELKAILLSCLEALGALHRENRAHSDVRPENVHYSRQSGRVVLLERFDKSVSYLERQRQTAADGRALFVAPWIFEGLCAGKRYISANPLKLDLFSLGIVVLDSIIDVSTVYARKEGRFRWEELNALCAATRQQAKSYEEIVEFVQKWLLKANENEIPSASECIRALKTANRHENPRLSTSQFPFVSQCKRPNSTQKSECCSRVLAEVILGEQPESKIAPIRLSEWENRGTTSLSTIKYIADERLSRSAGASNARKSELCFANIVLLRGNASRLSLVSDVKAENSRRGRLSANCVETEKREICKRRFSLINLPIKKSEKKSEIHFTERKSVNIQKRQFSEQKSIKEKNEKSNLFDKKETQNFDFKMRKSDKKSNENESNSTNKTNEKNRLKSEIIYKNFTIKNSIFLSNVLIESKNRISVPKTNYKEIRKSAVSISQCFYAKNRQKNEKRIENPKIQNSKTLLNEFGVRRKAQKTIISNNVYSPKKTMKTSICQITKGEHFRANLSSNFENFPKINSKVFANLVFNKSNSPNKFSNPRISPPINRRFDNFNRKMSKGAKIALNGSPPISDFPFKARKPEIFALKKTFKNSLKNQSLNLLLNRKKKCASNRKVNFGKSASPSLLKLSFGLAAKVKATKL